MLKRYFPVLGVLLAGALPVLPQQKSDELDIPHSSVPLLPAARVWDEPFEPLSLKGKFTYQAYSTFGPWAITRQSLFAGFDQWQNDPEEWGGGSGPYSKRFVSRLATTGARRTIQFAIGAIRHEDPRFFRSGRQGTWPRVKVQLLQTVMSRTDNGGKTVAVGRLAGIIAGTELSQLWLPASRDGVGQNFARAGGLVASDLGLRILREFWPDIRARFFRRGRQQQ